MTKKSVRLEIINERGLHARAAARFVEVAGKFDCAIEVGKDDQTVPGRSIMGLLLLVAGPGSAITVTADGPQAEEALSALADLVRNRFNEER